jgi:hypothetical protein
LEKFKTPSAGSGSFQNKVLGKACERGLAGLEGKVSITSEIVLEGFSMIMASSGKTFI